MTNRDDHASADGTMPQSTTNRSGGHRAKVAVGVVGLAAILGAGAYAITAALTKPTSQTTDLGAPAPQQQLPIDSSPQVSGSPSEQASPSTAATWVAPEVVASIKAAREKMAKDGVKVTRPLPEPTSTSAIVDLQRKDIGSLKEGGTVRVVSARSDLTGQEELRWVAGGITTYGDIQCSQTFKLFNSPKAHKKPNLLMCWRTSAKKSVVAAVVDPKGKPSRAKALDAVEKKWREMQ